MTRDLDLCTDDPEDFEGRRVVIDDVEYRIGPWVGEGGDRIVHQLVNQQSGYSLHLIKVFKDRSGALEKAEKTRNNAALAREAGLNILECLVFRAHNGVFELEETRIRESDSLHDLMALVQTADDAGNWEECERIGRIILSHNPYHVEAMYVAAVAESRRGNLDRAIELSDSIVYIEPNVRSFRQAQLRWLAQAGLFYSFTRRFHDFKEKWPLDNSSNSLSAKVFLKLGQPTEASELCMDGVDDSLRERVLRESRKWTIAAARLANAEAAVQSQDFTTMTAELAAAYEAYPKSPDVAVNWGITLLRNNDAARAAGVLETIFPTTPLSTRLSAVSAIVAMALTASKEYERAANYAAMAVEAFEGDGTLSIWDLPLWPVWYRADTLIEERSSKAFVLFEELSTAIDDESTAHAPLARLVDAYRACMAEILAAE
jgi:tetratricopeptide (TPR) repeat protein